MPQGWIRAWGEETEQARTSGFSSGKERSAFRRDFRTELKEEPDAAAADLATLRWGDEVVLPDGLSAGEWTPAEHGGEFGFLPTGHVVELAWVGRSEDPDDDDPYVADLDLGGGEDRELLWGDLVQVLRRDGDTCRVRVRGMYGDLPADRLRGEPLLETYFIDVGQGDGVLVRYPSGRHLLVDGGLPRANQLTGKNAADFIDWKFHVDYGHHAARLDGVVASHCDADHYGGLWDLARVDAEGDRELDCVELTIGTFFHAGLSRWAKRDGATPPHKDGLGPQDDGFFVRLLGDRVDAETSVAGSGDETLSGWWKSFIGDILERNPEASVARLGVDRKSLDQDGELPRMWDDPDVETRVLAPVTVERSGQPALKDLGNRGQNTNGHSVCLRLDHGDARILLTGDLNKKSMDWLRECYGEERMEADWKCDAVKACHHGSADISYRFLEHLEAAATVISSGDAEGHAHPRPEVVAASAMTGRKEVDRDKDRLVTPLVYMTEIERSVALGEVSHIGFTAHPVEGGEDLDGVLFAKPEDDISDSALLTREERARVAAVGDPDQRDDLERELRRAARRRLRNLDEKQREASTRAQYFYRTVRSLFNITHGEQPVWRSRIMTRNHYGLVNVRTDGRTVVCATMEEDESGSWTVHSFTARAGRPPG